jgi:hypothetical protein
MISPAEMQALRQAAYDKRAAVIPIPIWDARRAGDRIEGRIARFKNEPPGSNGYQAIIDTQRGQMAVWLIGAIHDDMVKQQAAVGDLVSVEYLGRIPDQYGRRRPRYVVAVVKANPLPTQ